MLARQRVNHLLDLGGDHVAPRELFDIKHLADEALGQHVLNQHLVRRRLAQIGVKRRPTQFHEGVEGRLERPVVAVRCLDLVFQPPAIWGISAWK